MDRKTNAQSISFRPLTQAVQVLQKEKLEWEPADLLPLSIVHQKERMGVPLGAECHLRILPVFLLLLSWGSWAAMSSSLVPTVVCPLAPQSPRRQLMQLRIAPPLLGHAKFL